jgi:chromosome segregation ATPase
VSGGNGASHVEVTPGHYCQDGKRFDRVEAEQQHLKAVDEQQEEAILQLAGEVSQARKATETVAERVGALRPDGTATPSSLTFLVLNLGTAVTKLAHQLDRTRDSVHHLEDESERTQVQSREELVQRARDAELALATARKSSVPPKASWQREAIKIALWATVGGGLLTTIQQILELFK